MFQFHFKLYQLSVGPGSMFFIPSSHLLGFIPTCPFTAQASALLAAKRLCWSRGAFSGSAQEQKETECRKKRKHCSGMTCVLSVSTFVWQNVTHWNCAHSMTLHFSLFCCHIFSPFVLLNIFNTTGAKQKTGGRADWQKSGRAILVWQFYSAWQQFW